MGLLTWLFGERDEARGSGGLAVDAREMRRTLDGLHAENVRVHGPAAPIDLRGMARDLLEGEVAAPTADVVDLMRRGVRPDEFYETDVRPSWEGLGEAQRAQRIEGFMELSLLMDAPGAAEDLPEEMLPRVHTKMLMLAWAFDETYGFISLLGRGG